MAAGLVDGSPTAIGVLGLLNHSATTFELLDLDVGLDRRAAENLIAHRDGADGTFGTVDDDSFDDVLEVDAVKWVGASALTRLGDYAEANGWVPVDDELLGVFDGVEFSYSQAEAVLQFVNRVTHSVLDDDVGLDRRAADAIVAARPVGDMPSLAGLSYVGRSALEKLKAFAAPDQPTGGPELGLLSDLDKTVIPPGPGGGVLPEAAYPGVVALYNELEYADGGQVGDVYYVTARKADGIDGVPEWLTALGIPSGPIFTGTSGIPWIARPDKVTNIEGILAENPGQNFIWVGDTNHVDPDVCRDLLALYPDRIRFCLLHEVRAYDRAKLVPGMHLFAHHAEAAALLFNQGVFTEDTARGVMDSARLEGLALSEAEREALLEQHRPN